MKASGRMRLCHYTLDGRVRSADLAVRRPDPRGGGRFHTSQLGMSYTGARIYLVKKRLG